MTKKILVIRFSALGDVLMTIPVVNALAVQYPDLDITFVSRPGVRSVVEMLPGNVHFKGIELNTYIRRKTILWIFRSLKPLKPDLICDLHFVLRSRIIGFLFRLRGTRVVTLDKDRDGRKRFLETRPLSQQKRMFERYAEVFEKAGFPVTINPEEKFSLVQFEGEKKGIGVAPFAAYKGKMLPLDKVEALVEKLSRDCPVYLFGAGEQEKSILDSLAGKYDNVFNMAGKLGNLAAELRFIAGLKLMISMDSANMHLASLAGTRVVSIWGATHPYAGFLGWGQKLEDCVQLDMDCRPCSIYGNKPCAKGDCPCMVISLSAMFDKV